MRRIIIFWVIVLATMHAGHGVNATTDWVCIDPGHGGPGASKYNNNGGGYNQGRGQLGPVKKLTEQWVNLQVALALRDSLESRGNTVLMTRDEQQDNPSYWGRVDSANYGFYGYAVDEFVSIHHNGLPLGAQGTEVWWTSTCWTDNDSDRALDSTLAMKIQMRLVNKWKFTGRYQDRCSYPRVPGHTCTGFCCDDCCYFDSEWSQLWICCWQDSIVFVLRNTIPPAALSEASNLNDTLEEHLFDTNFVHINEETSAIFSGIQSYIEDMGIAVVKNSFIDGNSMWLRVADWDWLYGCVNEDTLDSPYITCWLEGEKYCLKALGSFLYNGYLRTFHHWSHVNDDGYPIEPDWYDLEWRIVVPSEFDYHRYTAYFTGGPYSAQVVSPNGGEVWNVGQQAEISWNVSMGADSTTRVNIVLDRNGGNSGYPDTLAKGLWAKIYSTYFWTVSGSASTQCRIKIIAEDLAGNQAYDVSDNNFIISSGGPALWLISPNGGEQWVAQSQHNVLWNSYNYTSDVRIRYTMDGSDWYNVVEYTPNDGVYTWTLPPSGETRPDCRVKILDPSDGFPYDISDGDFTITPGPLYAPTGLSLSTSSGFGIRVQWTDNNPNELGYKIERKDSTNLVWAEICSTEANATWFQDTLNIVGSEVY